MNNNEELLDYNISDDISPITPDDPRVNKSSKKTSFVEGPGAKIFQERVRKAALEERAKEKKYEKSLGGIDISKYLKDRGIKSHDTGVRPVWLKDINEINRLIGSNYYPDYETSYNNALSANQSWGETMKRGFQQFGRNFISGVEDSASSWDFNKIYDVAIGSSEKLLKDEINKKAARDMSDIRIYSNSASEGLGDASYWAKAISSGGYTMGIMAEMFAEQGLIGLATGGVGSIASLGSKARLVGTLGKQAAFGTLKGVQEAYMNALETGTNIYEKYKELGYDNAASLKMASEASKINFRTEVGPLAVLNGLQFMSTFGMMGRLENKAFSRGISSNVRVGFSDAFEALGEKLTGKIGNKFLNKTVGFGVQGMSEGIEEGIQTGIQKYTENKVLKSTLNQNEKVDYFDNEMRDSVLQGAISGTIFAGLFKGVQGIYNRRYKNNTEERVSDFIGNAGTRTNDLMRRFDDSNKRIEQLNKEYETNKDEGIKKQILEEEKNNEKIVHGMNINHAFNALKLDFLKGDGTTNSFDSHINQMQEILDAVNKNDIAALNNYGLIDNNNNEVFKGSFDFIRNNFQRHIDTSLNAKKYLTNNLMNITGDYKSAEKLTEAQLHLDLDMNNREEWNKLFFEELNNNRYYNNLTAEEKSNFMDLAEKQHLEELEKMTPEQSARLEELEEKLKDFKISNVYAAKLAQIDASMEITPMDYFYNKNKLEESIGKHVENIANLSDKKQIKESVRKRQEEEIKEAKEIKELERLVKKAAKNGTLDKKLQDVVSNKTNEINAKNALSEEAKDKKDSTTLPKQNSEKSDLADKYMEAHIRNEVPQVNENVTTQPKDINKFAEDFVTGNLSSPLNSEIRDDNQENKPWLEKKENSENRKEMFKDLMSMLEGKLGKKPSFEDFISFFVKARTYSEVKKIYNGLASDWHHLGENNLTNEEKNKVFEKYFSNKYVESILSEKDLENETESATKNTVENTSPITYDNNDVKHIDDDVSDTDRKTLKSDIKGAFKFQDSERTENGDWVVKSKTLQNDILLNNYFILDHNFLYDLYKSGQELEIREIDLDEAPISTYKNENGETVISKTTWGEFKKQHNLKRGDELWKNKVPLVVFYGDTPIVKLHDPGWYNELSISKRQGEEVQNAVIKEGYDKIKKLREDYFNGKNKIKVSNFYIGTYDKTNAHTDKTILSVNEATGESIIAIKRNSELLVDNLGSTINKKLEGKILSNMKYVKSCKEGTIFDIRKIGVDKETGKDIYTALPVLTKSPNNTRTNLKSQVSNDVYNNIKYAILSHVLSAFKNDIAVLETIKNKYGFTVSQSLAIQNGIKNSLGLNISNHKELNKYIEAFVYKSSLYSFKLDNTTILESLEKLFGENGVLSQDSFNVNKDFLSDREGIPIIDNNGNVTNKVSYNHFVKDNIFTNIISHKITDVKGKEIWITDIQPMVFFEQVENTDMSKNNTTIKTATKKESTEDLSKIAELEEKLKQAGLSERQIALAREFREKQNIPNINLGSRLNETVEQTEKLANLQNNKITKLTYTEQKQLINSLKSLIVGSLDINDSHVDYNELREKIRNVIKNHILPLIEEDRKAYEIVSSMEEFKSYAEEIQRRIDKLENIVEEESKLISTEKNNEGDLIKEFNQLFSRQIETIEDLDNSQEENFSISFTEKELKVSFSDRLRLMLLNIPIKNNKTGENIKSFLGLDSFHSADEIETKIKEVTTTIPSSWRDFIAKLDDKYDKTNLEVYKQIKEKFQALPDDLKNLLLYKTISKPATYEKILSTPIYESVKDPKTGEAVNVIVGYEMSVLNENSNNASIKISNYLKDNFFNNKDGITNFIIKKDGKDFLDLDYIRKVSNKLSKFIVDNSETNSKSVEEIYDIFKAVGLGIFNEQIIEQYLKENNPFAIKQGILYFVNEKLKKFLSSNNTDIDVNNPKNYLFEDSSKALKTLTTIKINLQDSPLDKSVRVNGKNMQGVVANTSIATITNDLKNRQGIFYTFQKAKMTENNFLLNFLKESDDFANYFNFTFTSPDFYKEHGKNNYNDADVDKLESGDNIRANLALYTYSKLTNFMALDNLYGYMGLKFRAMKFTTPALSDKGRQCIFNTVGINFDESNLIVLENNFIQIGEEVLNFLYEQLFESEFNRIVQSKNSEKTNIVGYDKASRQFHTLPIFNSIKVNNVNIIDLIEAGEVNPTIFKEEVKKIIQDYVQFELDNKINATSTEGELIDSGILDTNEESLGTRIKNVDSKYLNSRPGASEIAKLKYLTTEYIINNLLHQVNMTKLYLGDKAFYAKGNETPFIKGEDKVDSISLNKEANYSDIDRKIASIINKRAASIIAPGNIFANSEDYLQEMSNEYLQVCIQDSVTMSSIAKQLIERQYGKLDKQQEELFNKIEKYNNDIRLAYENKKYEEAKNLEVVRQGFIDELSKTAEDIADYFEIKGTDAQEYTTWRTHLDMLYRQGNLTKTEKNIVKSAYEEMSKGNFDNISPEALKIIMQPVKPVYAGIVEYTNGDITLARPVYIKSSSYPLLPQVTKNLEIDNMRKHLEELEKVSGKNVRMSYQTANKIGAIDTKLTVEDLYYKNFNELYDNSGDNPVGVLADSIMVLPTRNLKIQQETPYKQGKYFAKGKDAMLSLASQFFKIDLANDISNMGEIFPNMFDEDFLKTLQIESKENLSGKDLEKIKLETYKKYSKIKKESLLKELNLLDKSFFDMSVTEQNEVIKSLVKILEKEIISRGYPDYLRDVIKLVYDTNDGVDRISTELPLIFDSNANKFESLLNGIISSRLIFHKMPGNQHISSSSEGYRFKKAQHLENLSENDKSGIIWVNPDFVNKNELEATFENGKLVRSQILIPSHWNYTKINEDGTVEYKRVDLSSDAYSRPIIKNIDGVDKIIGRSLILKKIDKELIDMFTFRIPTSSHQSGALCTVAGFLPEQCGDMIVTPKEHTVQLGEDYDVDKRNVYKHNYVVEENGNIRKLRYEDVFSTQERKEKLKEEYGRIKNELIQEIKNTINKGFKEENNRKIAELALLRYELKKYDIKNNSNFNEEIEDLKDSIETLEKEILSKEEISNLYKNKNELYELVDQLYQAFSEEKKQLYDNYVTEEKAKKMKLKYYENVLIDVLHSVYSSPNSEVQKKISKPLSTTLAENTANAIEFAKKEKNVQKKKYFSSYSDSYQRHLLKLGADGKTGIAVQSNFVILEAQLQRLEAQSKVALFNSVTQSFVKEKIGNLETSGKIGDNIKDLSQKEERATQHGENQNVCTDNINKGIMVKRNENEVTMNVYGYMGILGFYRVNEPVSILTKDGVVTTDKLSLPSLFLSQPIIEDYVKLYRTYNRISNSEFVSKKDIDKKILGKLSEKYRFHFDEEKSTVDFLEKEVYDNLSEQMTGQTLYDNFTENIALQNSELQAAVLQKFLRFKNQAEELSQYQQLINLSSSGLGLSFYETLQRIDTLNKLGDIVYLEADSTFRNMHNLIGNVLSQELYNRLSDNEKEDYTKLGMYYWKPTTVEGAMLIDSLSTSNEVMGTEFPYNSFVIKTLIEKIFGQKNIDVSAKSKFNLEWKYEIIQAFRDFIYTSSGVGMFNNIQQERERLFVDSENNKSLGTILNILRNENNPILDNPLLKDLEIKTSTKRNITLILSSIDNNTYFDKTSKYDAFKELLADDNTNLGTFNGEVLTPKKLAKDLASYAYLADTQKGATSFRNFIHIDYLKIMGITEKMREIYNSLDTNSVYNRELINTFMIQYFQHNPERALNMNASNTTANDILKVNKELERNLEKCKEDSNISITNVLNKKLTRFVLAEKEEVENPSFITIRNNDKDLNKKFSLYTNIFSEDGSYMLINNLGILGMNEYNANNIYNKSIVSTNVVSTKKLLNQYNEIPLQEKLGKTKIADVKGLRNIREFIETFSSKNINREEYKNFAAIIDEIKDFIDLNIPIKFETPINSNDKWTYSMKENIIYIHPDTWDILLKQYNGDITKVRENILSIYIEEILHANTALNLLKYMEKYDEKTGEYVLKENSPLFVQKLVGLYEAAKQILPYDIENNENYYSKSIFEFLVGMFANKTYAETLENNSEGFIQKFYKIIKDLFRHLYNTLSGKTLDYKSEMFNSIIDLVKLNPRNNFEIFDEDTGEVINVQNIIKEDDVVVEKVEEDKKVLESIGFNFNSQNNSLPNSLGSSLNWVNENHQKLTAEVEDNKEIKEDVSTNKLEISKLFESNPELANQVYEALGFNNTGSISKEDSEKVDRIFKKYPELAKLFNNDKQLYNNYLKSIFPNSSEEFSGKLFFHGTKNPIEGGKFKISDKSLAKGLWFTKQLGYAKMIVNFKDEGDNPITYGVVLNISNPKHFYNNSGALLVQRPSDFEKEYDRKNNDAAVFHHPESSDGKFTNQGGYNQVVVFNDNQVHIIGDENDIIKAKEFLQSTQNVTPKQKQQAQQLYSQYLDTIFPDSKVKDIVYHNTNTRFDKFDKSYIGKNTNQSELPSWDNVLGFFFTKERHNKYLYDNLKSNIVLPVLLDMRNPGEIYWDERLDTDNETYGPNINDVLNVKKDFIEKGFDSNNQRHLIVFEPEQIHILGSKQDIQGFKEFVQGKQFQKLTAEEKTKTIEQVTKEHSKLNQESGSLVNLPKSKIDNLQNTVEYQLLNEKDEDLDKKVWQAYIFLSEKDTEKFTYLVEKNKEFPKEFKVTKKITKYEKDSKNPLKFNGYNEYVDFYYVKSNNNKKSNLYNIINKESGEIVASKVRVLSISKDSKSEIASKYGLEYTPTKVFSANRSIAFALYRQKPSKAKYIAQAKKYLYDAIKFLNPEETNLKINLNKIEELLNSFPEEMWDYINATYSPEDSTNINASISLQNEIKFKLPKLGFLQEIEKIVGIPLQGVSFKNYDRSGSLAKAFKYSKINGEWGNTITIDNSMTTKELKTSIRYYLSTKKIFKQTSEEENVRKYAEHRGVDYNELRELVFGDIDKALDNIAYNQTGNSDTMELSKWRESIKNYDWQSAELFSKPYENFQNTVRERIVAKFKDKNLSNGISHLEYFFNSGTFNWLNINFNNISGQYYIADMETEANVGVVTKMGGIINPFEMKIYQKPKAGENFLQEKEVFNRLAAILHEPFHALHALSYGTKEEIELRKAFDNLYNTEFGKEMMNQVFGSGYNKGQKVSYDTLYKEFTAFSAQLMLYPKQWIKNTDLRSNDIYEFIEKIQTLQDKTYEEIVKTQQKIGSIETTIIAEEKIKLSFLEKLYNYLIKALNKIIPLSKTFTNLIVDSKLVEKKVVEDVFGEVEETITKTLKLPENVKKSKEEFLQAMDELKSSINILMQIDSKLFSSENITNFFTSNKFNQEEGSKQDIGEFKEFVNSINNKEKNTTFANKIKFTNGKFESKGFEITEEEFNNMSDKEKENFINCL